MGVTAIGEDFAVVVVFLGYGQLYIQGIVGGHG